MSKPLHINADELTWSFIRSSGPGGQNVNKTNSCAVLEWNLQTTQSLTLEEKQRAIERLRSQLTNTGVLQIRSQSHRRQEQNQDECLRKLYNIVAQAIIRPKKRVATKPSRSSVRKRLATKSKHADKKSQRRKQIDF